MAKEHRDSAIWEWEGGGRDGKLTWLSTCASSYPHLGVLSLERAVLEDELHGHHATPDAASGHLLKAANLGAKQYQGNKSPSQTDRPDPPPFT